jgi:uncharacterized MnhB-related membrane protein
MVACAIGAAIAAFAVTARDNLNAWIATGFAFGVLINLTLVIVLAMKLT